MTRMLVLAGVLCAAVTVAAGIAFAGGGDSIATAQPLPIGTNVTGGGTSDTCTGPCEYVWDYGNNWSIDAAASDKITIDYGSTNQEDVTLCILPPGVTDYTIDDSHCLASDQSNGKHEMKFVFPTAGKYFLNVSSGCCNSQFAYQLTAYLQHYTSATLSAPSLVRVGANVTLVGRISGASGGTVQLRYRPGSGAWHNLSVRPLDGNGSFSDRVRVSNRGTYRIQVLYYGDSSHQPSSAVTVLRAA